MTITDQIKILDRKIMQNQAPYDLDRKAAKISTLSFHNLYKYEYLTGKDLGLKPSAVEQTNFEYSPLGKTFSRVLNKDEDKKEGLLKRLKNFEHHGKKQLDRDPKSLQAISYFSQLSTKAKEFYVKIIKEKNDIDPEEFACVKTDGTIFNFNKFKPSQDLASNIYRDKNLLKDAENKQSNIKILLNKLRNYNPTKPKKIKAKEETLSAAEKLLNNRQDVIDAFKTGIFPYIDGSRIKKESEEESGGESEEESEEKKLEKIKDDFKKFIEYIGNESKSTNCDLFKDFSDFWVPSALAKKLYETKNKRNNSKLLNTIKDRWSHLEDKVKEMSEDEKEIEQPDRILKIVEEILNSNKEIWQKEGLRLKILTRNQMLSRLPISLAQLKTGNNSEKLKNEIRQLLYSLYRSKKLTNNSIKVWLTLFKIEKNRYEQGK